MRSQACLTVGPGHGGELTFPEVRDGAPIAWRCTPGAVYMVGTAASPVGSDDVTVSVQVLAGAALTIRSAAASIAWSGAGTSQKVRVTVGAGADLVWCPEALIATAGCAHVQEVTVDLDPTASLTWRDILVLGRSGERPGTLESRLRVTVDGVPLLHHVVAVGERHPGWDGPAVLGAVKVLGQMAFAGGGTGRTGAQAGIVGGGPGATDGATWSLSPLAGPGALATVAAGGVAAAESALAVAASRVGRPERPCGPAGTVQ